MFLFGKRKLTARPRSNTSERPTISDPLPRPIGNNNHLRKTARANADLRALAVANARLRKKKTDLDDYDTLVDALETGDLNTVKTIITDKDEANTKLLTGDYPIHYAIFHPKIVTYLISKGANVNLRNTGGVTPLFKILMTDPIENRHIEVAHMLLDNDADPTIVPSYAKGMDIIVYLEHKERNRPSENLKELIDRLKTNETLMERYKATKIVEAAHENASRKRTNSTNSAATGDPVEGGRRKTRRRSKRRLSRRR